MGLHCLKIRNTGSPRLPTTEVVFYSLIVEAMKSVGKTGSTLAFEVQKVRQGVFDFGFVGQRFICIRHGIMPFMVLRGIGPHWWVNGNRGGIWGSAEE